MEHKNQKNYVLKKIKNKMCVEVNAMDEEGTEVIIRKNIGDTLCMFKGY